MKKRVLLTILDGWGIGDCSCIDAICKANTPNFNKLKKTEKFTTIHADGEFVGLPDGQMGNSEVGHLNLGAGRIVYQELTKINKAIREKSFFENEEFLNVINHVQKNNSSLHLMGLVSDGGVHSSLDHLFALIELAAQKNIKKVYVHAFLDGRDTPPQSAVEYLKTVENHLKKNNLPQISTVSGRYWAMDRDNRWDRVEKAYNALLLGEGETAENSICAVELSYSKNETDEFVLPTITNKEPSSRIQDNDGIIFFNFRPDRAREITKAITFENFDGFDRKVVRNNIYFVTMTQYDEIFITPIAFRPQKLNNILGDVLDANNIKQFRTAETEKYAHITFFFNGGIEEPNKLETRKLVNSPKVATYDLQPEMSAVEVCDNVLEALENDDYEFILVNFANPDMVGHTGNFDAVVKAIETVDECVGKIVKSVYKNNVTMLLTADHGNAEIMIDPNTKEPFTAHTNNKVPFFVINPQKEISLKEDGGLCDIAPTVLSLLGIQQPEEMTGVSMING